MDREGTGTATWEPTRRRAEKEGRKEGWWEGAREGGRREGGGEREERGRDREETLEQRTEELGLARGAGKGRWIEGVWRHLGLGQGARW